MTTMPFQSKAQQGFMFAKHPAIAKRWASETPDMKHLPEYKDVKKQARRGALLKQMKGGK